MQISLDIIIVVRNKGSEIFRKSIALPSLPRKIGITIAFQSSGSSLFIICL
jgi:hypothetical protein